MHIYYTSRGIARTRATRAQAQASAGLDIFNETLNSQAASTANHQWTCAKLSLTYITQLTIAYAFSPDNQHARLTKLGFP